MSCGENVAGIACERVAATAVVTARGEIVSFWVNVPVGVFTDSVGVIAFTVTKIGVLLLWHFLAPYRVATVAG